MQELAFETIEAAMEFVKSVGCVVVPVTLAPDARLDFIHMQFIALSFLIICCVTQWCKKW